MITLRFSIVALLVLVAGCASVPVRAGRMYAVQWPGQPLDIVHVEEATRNGYAICRSVKDLQEWVCNFNLAIYWAHVVEKEQAAVFAQATGR